MTGTLSRSFFRARKNGAGTGRKGKAACAGADTEERKSIYRDAMDIIMDRGCELPLYQRKNCYVASSVRVDNDTMPKEMTPFHNRYSEIRTLAVK